MAGVNIVLTVVCWAIGCSLVLLKPNGFALLMEAIFNGKKHMGDVRLKISVLRQTNTLPLARPKHLVSITQHHGLIAWWRTTIQ